MSLAKSVLLFQMGEFVELITSGRARATDHCVQKASGVERFAFAVFVDPAESLQVTRSPAPPSSKNTPIGTSLVYPTPARRSYSKYNPAGSVAD